MSFTNHTSVSGDVYTAVGTGKHRCTVCSRYWERDDLSVSAGKCVICYYLQFPAYDPIGKKQMAGRLHDELTVLLSRLPINGWLTSD